MSENDIQDYDPLLMQLVLSLQTAAMIEMGKLINPQTGKAERRLPLAKNSIDMLGMLEAKTKGNLTTAEAQHLEHTLYELRLNYLDESERPNQTEGEGAASGATPSDTHASGETNADKSEEERSKQ